MEVSIALERWLSRILRRWPLSHVDRAQVLSLRGTVQRVERRRDLVRLGQSTDCVHLTLEGLVGRYGQSRDGLRQLVALHLPGEMAGMQSTLLPSASCALTALSDLVLYRIEHETVRQLLHSSPLLGVALWGDCALDAAVSEQWMVNIARRNAVSRVAHLLCELALRYEALGSDRFAYRLPMTQLDLAEALGLTGVHLNRKLRDLREAGMVEWREGVVRILDWSRLARVGEFDGGYIHLGARGSAA